MAWEAVAARPEDRAQNGRRVWFALQVQAVRSKRYRGERAISKRRRIDRRHRGDSLDACRRAEPRAVAALDELWRCAVAAAESGIVGHLWARFRKPESAGLHRDVSGRISDSGITELAERFP